MGMFPLLLIAMTGITFGWQPDGADGVEYTIQVSPTELDDIRRIGEITSTIDPQVAGHVSRIKIVVGTETLPKQTPKHLAGTPVSNHSDSYWSEIDNTAVPIPEIDSRGQAIPLAANGNAISRRTRVMKPDPQTGTTNNGFAMPPSLQDPANQFSSGIQTQINRAGRAINRSTATSLNAPTPASSNPNAAPGFSSVQNSNQPPSQGPGLNMRAGASPALQNAVSNATGNNRMVAPATQTNSNVAGSNRTAPTAVSSPPPAPNLAGSSGSTNNAGQTPTPPPFTSSQGSNTMAATRHGGPSTEPTSQRDNTWNHVGQAAPKPQQANTNIQGMSDTLSRSVSGQPSTTSRPGDTFGKWPSGMTLSQTNQSGRSKGTGTGNLGSANISRTGNLNTNAGSQRNANSLGQPRPAPTSDRFSSNSEFSGRINGQSPFANPAQQRSINSPDPRLSPSQIAAGAWSFDSMNRPIDRHGRLVHPTGNMASHPFPPSGIDANRFGRNNLPPNQAYSGAPIDSRYTYDPRSGMRPSAAEIHRTAAIDTPGGSIERESSVSLAKNRKSTENSSSDQTPAKSPPEPIAAQRLFNGLLLMSVVANVYLMFWLKNLRLRFRDLVAAKKLSGPSAQPA